MSTSPIHGPTHDVARLNRVAALLEGEAFSWEDGFTIADGDKRVWPADDEWAHVRYVKLMSGAAYLRKLARRLGNQVATAKDQTFGGGPRPSVDVVKDNR